MQPENKAQEASEGVWLCCKTAVTAKEQPTCPVCLAEMQRIGWVESRK